MINYKNRMYPEYAEQESFSEALFTFGCMLACALSIVLLLALMWK